MLSLNIKQSELDRLAKGFAVTPSRMNVIGFYLSQQVTDRFRTAGASGGVSWPPRKIDEWGANTGRAILTGSTGNLLNSFNGFGKDNRAVVESVLSYAHVHQLGCVGKGGILPDIVPKRAKVLFIPITSKAENSTLLTGPDAAYFRSTHGSGSGRVDARPIRAGVRTVGYRAGKNLGATVYTGLVKGRLKDGHLQKWNAKLGMYVDGVPDFIFLRKVSISARPMLPDGNAEKQAQRELITETFRP